MITKFKLFESRMDQNIHDICKEFNIKNYVINPDGSISVDGNVDLSPSGRSHQSFRNSLEKLPLKFKEVSGYFDCSYSKLTSLEDCPKKVGGNFFCNHNNLTSLEGCPEVIGGNLFCSSNQIISFDGLPEFWEKGIDIVGNPIDEIYQLFNRDSKCIEWIREYDVIQGDKVSKHRLEEVFHTLNLEVPKDIKLKSFKLI